MIFYAGRSEPESGDIMYYGWKDLGPDIKERPVKTPAEDGTDGAGKETEYKSSQTAERTCVLSWETEHGKVDEAELPAYQYLSDGWEYQVI